MVKTIAELILDGAAPRTKKNSSNAFRLGPKCPRCNLGMGRLIVDPSESYKTWANLVRPQARKQWAGKSPISQPVNCCALIYRDRLQGDTVGYIQAIADLLEEAKVVDDDKWIVTWDGTKPLKDAKNPRVEITLTALGEEDAVRCCGDKGGRACVSERDPRGVQGELPGVGGFHGEPTTG